jgi:CBS-domain-containing membrane protein
MAQITAAILGFFAFQILGAGYAAAATAMVLLIVTMIALDVVHPPAVATALSFAFRSGDASNLVLFGLAVGITALLVVLEQVALWMLARLSVRR